jgi:uncharacterized membrane protein YccC
MGAHFGRGAMRWLRARDPGLNATRRALRTAVVLPVLFAIATRILHDPELATFAAFGGFAQMLLVSFSGSMQDRALNQVVLAVSGAALVCLGTLASRTTWSAVVTMAVVGFLVLFAGVVSSVLASASTGLLLAFILPVSLSAPASTIPHRVEGWLIAGGAAVVANLVLWPAPANDPLRNRAIVSCRLLAHRLRVGVAYASGDGGTTVEDRDRAVAAASDAVATMLREFYATPNRPTALTTSARAIVRLVDEIGWLATALAVTPPDQSSQFGNTGICAVKASAASVLECGAGLLAGQQESLASLDKGLAAMAAARDAMEAQALARLPLDQSTTGDSLTRPRRVVDSLEPTFRAQEVSFAVGELAANVRTAVAADRRTWWQRVLGRQPAGAAGPVLAAQQRAASHFDRHSVWLRNSVRGAIALAAAVFVADTTGVQHSFWVILGTLSVLRSNALSTGQTIAKGLQGTVVGLVIGSLLVIAIGTNDAVLWVMLPIAIAFAGFAPTAISFAAGQAAFSISLLVLFNLIAPAGWQIGLVRLEDVALGCAVSLVVGFLFWPRGAGAALRHALAEAYADSADYLRAAVAAPASAENRVTAIGSRVRAAAAARRLDDAFRQLLNERGPRVLPMAEATRLVTGVAGVRLAADATLDLWERQPVDPATGAHAVEAELTDATRLVTDWYFGLAYALRARRPVADPVPQEMFADGRLVSAVRHDVQHGGGQPTPAAVSVIWTADHLDEVRRLQHSIVGPARAVAAG